MWASNAYAADDIAIQSTASHSAIAESEPNNDPTQANSIVVNQWYVGTYPQFDNFDYYRFSLTNSGVVSIETDSEYVNGSGSWQFSIQDKAGNQIYFTERNHDTLSPTTSVEVGLPAGEYYLRISGRSPRTSEPYQFSINFKKSDNWETEPNDNYGDADEILLNKTYAGTKHDNTDSDYFTFTLQNGSYIAFTGEASYSELGGKRSFAIRDTSGKNVLSTLQCNQADYSNSKTVEGYLPAGKYFIYSSATGPAHLSYSFSVKALSNYGFADVIPGDWYATDDVLGYAISEGLLSGYDNGLFGPYDGVTRGQVATILWRIAGQPSTTAPIFSDVDYSQYYGKAICWARATGVISGYGDTNTFAPESLVTRQELCVMLSNYASKIARLDTSSDCAALSRISGYWEVEGWAREQMGWAVDNGIVSGEVVNGTAFVNPSGTAQRCALAKMASVFHRDVLGLG